MTTGSGGAAAAAADESEGEGARNSALASYKSRTMTTQTQSKREFDGLSAGALVSLCEETLKTFDPVVCTLDSHAESVLEKQNNLVGPDKEFVKQVLYGCVRYKSILKTLITSFYFNNGATTSRGDYTKYMVLSYLALLRLDELGFAAFARLVRSQAAEKMHVFLTYIFDKKTLEKWVKDKWIEYYDLGFIENVVMAGVDKAQVQARELCDELSEAAFGVAQRQAEAEKNAAAGASGVPDVWKKPPTIPKPFNITPVRPVRVSEPVKIKQCVTANPVPEHLNDRTLADIEAEREAARARAAEETRRKYEKDETFKLCETKDTLTKAVEAQERELRKIMNKKFRAKPVPEFEAEPSSVKLNAAAILREDALYKKKQEQEAQLLRAYEEDLRDSTEFYAWQSQQREEDEKSRLRAVEERRLASALSQQQAKLAHERKIEENRRVAVEMNAESKVIQAHAELQKEEHVEANRERVSEVVGRREVPRIEREKIAARKREQMRETREEQRRLEERKRAEEAKEQERRNDLIRRIRALERVPVVRVKHFDPTKSGGHGLLEEMSLVELKERLAMNEIKYAKEQDQVRRKIITGKVEKEKAMRRRLEEIRRAREAASAANRKARRDQRERDAERQRLEQELRDEAKLKLVDHLASVRAQRESEIRKLQEEEERLQKRNMFLGAAKEQVEAKAHEEFIKGMERKARDTQRRAQVEAQAFEAIKTRDLGVRNDYRRRQAVARRQAAAEAAASLESAREKTKAKNFAVFKSKRVNVQDEHERYRRAQQTLDAINPYATRMKQTHALSRATSSPASAPAR